MSKTQEPRISLSAEHYDRLQAERADLEKRLHELREAHRWRYPPEMPTIAGRYVVVSRQWGVVVDIWDREAGSATYRWRNFPDVDCWQPLPEPAKGRETE